MQRHAAHQRRRQVPLLPGTGIGTDRKLSTPPITQRKYPPRHPSGSGVRPFAPMKEVDSWVIFDNSENPRKQIASGGRHADTIIDEEVLYLKMQRYVK